MKEVTKDEYYKFIGDLVDVSLRTIGDYPYTNEWTSNINNKLIARSVDSYHDGQYEPTITTYFINS